MHVVLGLTETGIIRQFFLNHDTAIQGQIVPVGYAVPGKDVLILDEANGVAEPGSLGEIVVQSEYLPVGVGMTLLHWRHWLMTEDGCLLHLGRKDFQVKVRGYRSVAVEIEIALGEFPELAMPRFSASEITMERIS